MADVMLSWNPALCTGDWSIARGTLAGTATGSQDLENAVLVSLFTDQVAPVDYVFPDQNTDPRGWWADTFTGSPIGSLLWTLNRAKKTDASLVLNQAQSYCLTALQWLIDDGVAGTVTADCTWFKPDAMGIVIAVTKPSGQAFSFAWTWQGF